MTESELVDHFDRERFRFEWDRNFAVSANAGSGKTTAISARLAAMARSPEASALLPKTAVVTFTNKAATQIGQRARAVLLKQLTEEGARDLSPLDHLERAFFGTIHSFCLLLAQRYGQNLGIHLNPTVVSEADDQAWEEFVEQDEMQFASLEPAQVSRFLRHIAIENIFELSCSLGVDTAQRLLRKKPIGLPPQPSATVLQDILDFPQKGAGKKNIRLTQEAARSWAQHYLDDSVFLRPFEPAGEIKELVRLAEAWMKPLKDWLAQAAAVLAAEMAMRYRAYRLERGIQTYADQTEAAVAVLRDRPTLERIRQEGWRVILDEAQDTDVQQFAVLAEIARPVGAELGTWPVGGGAPPRPGHFCMVGDGQQAIYGARADIKNFLKHLKAFQRGDGGELLRFRVTFRAPRLVVNWLNEGLPAAFSHERTHNLGVAVAEGAPPTILQVTYEPLAAAPLNVEGAISLFALEAPAKALTSMEEWLIEEARQLAKFFAAYGPSSIGASRWGEVTLLAPRREWLNIARRVLEREGLKVALQVKRHRQRDNAAFAWLTGVLSIIADPDNAYEFFGVLREVFGVSDAMLAAELRERGSYRWDEPEAHPSPLANALLTLRPFILKVDDGGQALSAFIEQVAEACGFWDRLAALDPSGAQQEDLSRLIAEAAEFGRTGAGLRDWLRILLTHRDEGRPVGKAEPDAINLLTAHSAKGLEWPVVIPLGLWRGIQTKNEPGLRLIATSEGEFQVFLDDGSVPADTQDARERERLRELLRLFYVTMTRVQRHLIIPWASDFGKRTRGGSSFAELWGNNTLLESLPRLSPLPPERPIEALAGAAVARHAVQTEMFALHQLPPLPERLLPHQLGKSVDAIRLSRHEATSVAELGLLGAAEDAIEYGLWWHETMEFMPWGDGDEAVNVHCESSLLRAKAAGYGERAAADLARLRESAGWTLINESRWMRLAELAVFAPATTTAWIDGVVDLALHDASLGELCVIDWKTNRVRAGESAEAFAARLKTEYTAQLAAYAQCLESFFPGKVCRLSLYATSTGELIDIQP